MCVTPIHLPMIWTHILEWYVVRHGSKNEHQRVVYLKEIGPHVQNVQTILSSTINVIGGGGCYMTTISLVFFWNSYEYLICYQSEYYSVH